MSKPQTDFGPSPVPSADVPPIKTPTPVENVVTETKPRFDRDSYQKNYMRTYMKEYRKRKKT